MIAIILRWGTVFPGWTDRSGAAVRWGLLSSIFFRLLRASYHSFGNPLVVRWGGKWSGQPGG